MAQRPFLIPTALAAVLLVQPAIAQEVLTHEAFTGAVASHDGKVVTLGPCELFITKPENTPVTCRLMNPDGDFRDANGLPWNVELQDIDAASQAYLDSDRCDQWGFCDTHVTVTGTVVADLIGFASLKGVTINMP